MNIIYQAMFYLLDLLHNLVHSYGLAIVLLTVFIRVALWPLNSAQARSMKKMQELQPKLKALQAKFKDNPQKMQEAMMKFYSENSFNPLAGCLPLLIQLPIFIGLYGALGSPQFLAETVDERFLFINNLAHTLNTHAGEPLDNRFAVKKDDTFTIDKTIRLTLDNGTTQAHEVPDPAKAITAFPRPVLPGSPVTLTLDFNALGLSPDWKNLVKSAQAYVVNTKSHEIEDVTFTNTNGALTQQIDTVPGKGKINMDVLILILIYGILTVLYQRVMAPKMAQNVDKSDPAAAAMQAPAMKFLPLMFVVMLFFIPIPAGVMIYLVVTTALMFAQTVWVNYNEDKKNAGKAKPSEEVIDVKAD